jgi:hypothetical protein
LILWHARVIVDGSLSLLESYLRVFTKYSKRLEIWTGPVAVRIGNGVTLVRAAAYQLQGLIW